MLKNTEFNTEFKLVEAEMLSLDDFFMSHQPTTLREKATKKLIFTAITKGVKNFYCARLAPSLTDDGEGIVFEAGKMPAVGKSYNWWQEAARNYKPEKNSRLGIRIEFGAYMAVLIKELMEAGMPVDEAWYAVCNDSSKLGHYSTSENASDDFEPTGSREVCGLYDLGNTYKLLAEECPGNLEGFWVAGGKYCDAGTSYPIADIDYDLFPDEPCDNSVGWVIHS